MSYWWSTKFTLPNVLNTVEVLFKVSPRMDRLQQLFCVSWWNLLLGNIKDIVAIYPMSKLTAAKQHDCYKEVVALLQDVSLNLVGISVDNASTNRKFFCWFLMWWKIANLRNRTSHWSTSFSYFRSGSWFEKCLQQFSVSENLQLSTHDFNVG